MLKFELPKKVEIILDILNRNGYQAYVVGGCVRDRIMGIPPHDWDICTSALPDQIMDAFSGYRVIPTGLQHGTVTVVVDREEFEITTFRIDGEYKDNRHPESVEFVEDLKLDLMRRDFTINAMAYNPTDGLIDYFGGQEDIKSKVIRCVGNPYERFKEDALRIIRAYRFAIRYGFEIERETSYAAVDLRESINSVSIERINSELVKILECELKWKEGKLYPFIRILSDINPYLDKLNGSEILEISKRLSKTPCILNVRLALLFDFKLEELESCLKRFRFSNETIKSVIAISKYGRVIRDNYIWLGFYPRSVALKQYNKSYYCERKLLHDIGFNLAMCAAMYAKAFINDSDYILYDIFTERIEHAEIEKLIYRLSDLAVDGNDIMKIGYAGKQIGKVLNVLLDFVMKDIVENERDVLMGLAESIKDLDYNLTK